MLLENEQSFDRLFCETKHGDYFTLFYNEAFADDPIFNHFVIKPTLLERRKGTRGGVDSEMFQQQIEQTLESIRSIAQKLHVKASVFIEDFWPLANELSKKAIEDHYRLSGRMDILSMELGSQKSNGDPKSRMSNPNIEIEITKDVENWNNVFVRSFNIGEGWHSELAKRLQQISIDEPTTKLILARHMGKPSGCLLLHRFPKEVMGVYCVGTLPEARGKGIAKEMMKKSKELASDEDCKFMTLQTIEEDFVSGFYTRIGYKVVFRRSIFQ